MNDQPTGREPALPFDVAITGREPALPAYCWTCKKNKPTKNVIFGGIIIFRLCDYCHDQIQQVYTYDSIGVAEFLHFKDYKELMNIAHQQWDISTQTHINQWIIYEHRK